jgi:hypothetical protein
LGMSWGTTWGTPWEHDENTLGTHWEQGKNQKKLPPPDPQKEKTGPLMSAC